MLYLDQSTHHAHWLPNGPSEQIPIQIPSNIPKGLYIASMATSALTLHHLNKNTEYTCALSPSASERLSTRWVEGPEFCYVSPYPYLNPLCMFDSPWDTRRLLYASSKTQSLSLWDLNVRAHPVVSYPIATATRGLGQREGSYMTPTGLHCVTDYIGNDLSPDTFFLGREPQGDYQQSLETRSDWILSRILRLDGVESGWNQGQDLSGHCVDTRTRHIYIHGTPSHLFRPEPSSHGCVRMRPTDVVELFDRLYPHPIYLIIEEGDGCGSACTLHTS